MLGSKSGTRTAVSLDLLAVVIVTIAAVGIVTVPGFLGSSIRVGVGIVFVLFAPGYALVSLLLPERTTAGASRGWPVTTTERIVLSIGMSAIVVPLVGYAIHYTMWRIDETSMVLAVGAVTLVSTVLAWGRRRRATQQFGIDPSGSIDRITEFLVVPDQSRETAFNLVIVLGIVVAMATIGAAAATNGNGERYTEFYLLSEDPETGALVADEYPTEGPTGGLVELHVGIGNQEQQTVTYTVVAQLERIDRTGGDPVVTERVTVDTFEATVGHNESVERSHTVEPTLEGENLRLTYLLYADTPPQNPTRENAYRSTHVWIDTTGPASVGAGS